MGINLASSFDMNAALPLDSRTTVANAAARDAIVAGKLYEGLQCWVQDEDLLYIYDGAGWVEFSGGGGSGVGSDETLFSYNFEDMETADLGTTFDILSAGTGGSVTVDAVSPLHGLNSLKVVHPSSFSAGFGFNALPIPLKFRGKRCRFSFDVLSDAAANDIFVEMYDNTNAAYLIPSGDSQPTTIAGQSVRASWEFDVPATCLDVYFEIGFQSGAFTSYVDDILFEAIPLSTELPDSGANTQTLVFQLPYDAKTINILGDGLATAIEISGIDAGTDGQTVTLINQSAVTVKLANNSGVLAAADMLFSTGLDEFLAVGETATFTYSSQWYCTAKSNTLKNLSNETSFGNDAAAATFDITVKNEDALYPKLRFDNTEKKWKYSNDGVEFANIGSGKSAPDIMFHDAFDDSVTGDYTITGFGALTVFSPLHGEKSFVLQHDPVVVATVARTYDVDGKFRGKNCTLLVDVLSTCPVGSVTLTITDTTNAVVLVASEQMQFEASASFQNRVSFDVPADCFDLEYKFTGAIDPASNYTVIDDVFVMLTESLTTETALVQEEDFVLRCAGNAGQAITASVTNLAFIAVSSQGTAAGSWNGTQFTVTESGIYTFSGSAFFAAASARRLELYIDGTIYKVISNTAVATSAFAKFDITDKFTSGQVITLRTDTAGTLSNSATYHYLNIVKQGALKQVNVNSNQKIKIPTSELRFETASARGATATAIVYFTTLTKLRGDAFTVESDATLGTRITMKKAGKLDISTSLFLNAGVYISLNQSVLTAVPVASEILNADQGSADRAGASASVFVKVGDVLRVASEVAPTANAINNLNLTFQEQEIQVSVSNTLPQFSDSDSSVRVDTANGYGSTATRIRRFLNVRDNVGVDVLYADSATNGASFTAITSGVYHLSYSDTLSGINNLGISKNASSLTTNIVSIAALERLTCSTTGGADYVETVSWQGYLVAGDVIRAHTNGTTTGATPALVQFTMSKVGKPNVTGVNVTPFMNIDYDQGVIGEVRAFAGAVDTLQYLPCDGSAVSRSLYSELFLKIGTTHGQGNGSSTFNVPDYRGRFLRGTANGSTNDPDRASRTAMATGGNTGDLVGSVQADANLAHVHETSIIHNGLATFGTGTSRAGGFYAGASTTPSHLTQSVGGTEARPKNAYVNYGIRFKAANIILTEVDTFNSDTATFTYKTAAQYTLATLANANIGDYITYTYAISSLVSTQTSLAPLQSDLSKNTDGLFIQAKNFAASPATNTPGRYAIQIGKGHKGLQINGYGSAGKLAASEVDLMPFTVGSSYESGLRWSYNELTGILDINIAPVAALTTRYFGVQSSSMSVVTNGYITINASKNPALTGLNVSEDVAVRAVNTAGTSIATGSTVVVTYDAVETFDTHNAFNAATGVFTSPKSGFYSVSGKLKYQAATYAVGNQLILTLFKNGAQISELDQRQVESVAAHDKANSGSDTVYLAKGDTLDMRAFNNRTAGATLLSTGTGACYISIRKAGN